METALSLAAALGLAAVHLSAGRLRFLGGVPRSIWLSAAGGISVAYVFIHLLPELGAGHETLSEHPIPWFPPAAEHPIYVIALVGLVVFYGMERAAVTARRRRAADEGGWGVFALHLATFAVYNGIVGYLLVHREHEGPAGLALYFFAMALHFLVNDYGLREHYPRRYHRFGRWALAAMPLLGWALGLHTRIREPVLAALFAFLAGGIVLNVLKEELPEERESRFGAFLLGAALYAALLFTLG